MGATLGLLLVVGAGADRAPMFALPTATTDAGNDDDCSLSREAIAPMLDDAKLLKQYAVKRDDRRVTERAVLNGRVIETSVGGCEHFGFAFTFTLLKGEAAAANAGAVRLARTLLEGVPVKGRGKEHRDRLVDTLKTAIAKPIKTTAQGTVELPCGDANCELSVSDGTLTVGYDFAL